MNYRKVILSLLVSILWLGSIPAQQVPFGIHYQAVARNSYGEELANRQIDIRFSIRSGTAIGNLEYQEVHSGIVTSAFGVFDAVIGTGTPVGGDKESFDQIGWELDNHFVVVEIKFGTDFMNMGAMQFLSVPYALYAARSLEPGPEGPPGPAGDPATDDQTLSITGTDLTISDGNTISLAAIAKDPNDEIQYLSIEDNSLSITNGNSIELQEINIDDADADPTNEIQTLNFNSVSSRLDIIGGNWVDLSTLTNTDNQQLSYDPVTHVLTITNGTNSVDLDDLKDDDDADPTNELISSAYISGSELIIEEGSTQHSVDLSSNMVAFRVKKTNPTDAAMPLATVDFLPDDEDYNDGLAFNMGTGEFTVPINGIYSFDINYTSGSNSVNLYIYKNGIPFETIGTNLSISQQILRHKTFKLSAGDRIKLSVYTGTGTAIGTGIFSGFRVY